VPILIKESSIDKKRWEAIKKEEEARAVEEERNGITHLDLRADLSADIGNRFYINDSESNLNAS